MKLLFSRWTQAAGLLLMGGALAWAIKLGVIVATNGRVIDTGAAALFMKIGLLLYLAGSTGIGHRLTPGLSPWIRTVAILLSPVVVFGSFPLLAMLTAPLVEHSTIWYARQEAGIGVVALVYGLVGYLLYRSYRPLAPVHSLQR